MGRKKERPVDEDKDTDCTYCDRPLFRSEFREAVKDHCHVTGKFWGAAHNACKWSYFRINPKTIKIPVVLHNMKGYDAHLIMKKIAGMYGTLNCIPNNMEKYISFSLGKLRFIDSYGFLLSNLDNLVSSNKSEDFEIIKQAFPDLGQERLALLIKKGIYP